MYGACRGRLVAAAGQEPSQRAQHVGGVFGVVLEQWPERSLDERLDPWILPEDVQQASQLDVGQFVEGLAVGRSSRRLGDLFGSGERLRNVREVSDRASRADHRRGKPPRPFVYTR